MDELQEHLARIGLRVIAGRGFALGGGHAIELHGMGTNEQQVAKMRERFKCWEAELLA
jgi:hypothetical protein